ncbi:hypothetical protein JOD45_002810 [Scopulibacillus daqui]|uniref:Uncharacterized protein n=1 Tax=Scopulibacillus daqui TaxID=1469162 RepID=A0ABS2Q2R2_9BACL|nr:hypothetical protein [Scopulibacillus daqui]MBM7646580.1 hypothetical protein [Scopulibacillus daqui]
MTINIKEVFKTMNDFELVEIYGQWLAELKVRNMIRTNNVVGELGEYLAIKYYQDTPRLPKLQAAPTGTQNIDAISINGDRYSIKSTTGNVTGVFYGLNDPQHSQEDKQKFEYVILVKFNKDFSLQKILELDWETFLKHKRWHKRMRAWNLSITKELINDSKVVFESESIS